jgi:hypothetical protein
MKAKRSFLGGVVDGERISFEQGKVYDLSKYPDGFNDKIKHYFEPCQVNEAVIKRKEVKVRGKKVETAAMVVNSR